MPTDDQAALIDWLRDRDAACPSCRYNLRGLTSPTCPECGQAVRLGVTLVDVYATAWVVLAVAVCGSAGLGLIFICIFARRGIHEDTLLESAIVFYMCMTPMPVPLLLTRRRFQRLPPARQWMIAGPLATACALAMMLFCMQLH